MQKKLVVILIAALAGLVIGYLLFGKIGGEYIDISDIFSSAGGKLGSFARKATGIAKIRTNILLTGGAGAVLGVIYTFVKKK
ncbi:hypothetical protein [Carboxylicivirga sp. N1Y90]|uniref:hypothetical protein n=1 Tax=Carboxylicivirga fragile TaxID=3417571 RepID=UPI003D326AFE|nr:hypothetical protein [Marinilabiliaceae bacterium N1Y90]